MQKTTNASRKVTTVMGVPVDLLSQEQVVDAIFNLVEEFRQTQTSHYIATLNVDFLVNAHGWHPGHIANDKLLQTLRQARIVTADGMPILWLSNLFGGEVPMRITGSDLFPLLAAESGTRGKAVYLLGGRESITQKASERLKNLYPNIKISGHACPWINEQDLMTGCLTDNDRSIVEAVNAAKPDILFLSLGNPKQELWFHLVKDLLKVPVVIGVGGSFAFVADAIKRAPVSMQNLGLEWAYRLYREPRRLWKRYLLDAVKFFYITSPAVAYHYFTKIQMKIAGSPGGANILYQHQGGKETHPCVQCPCSIDKHNSKSLYKEIRNLLQDHSEVVLDFYNVLHVDIVGITMLIELLREAMVAQRRLSSVKVSAGLERLIALHRATDLLNPLLSPKNS